METSRGERTEGLNVLFMNAQSIGNKMDELRAIAVINKPDILAITETWTNDAIADAFVCIDGYELVARDDRNDTTGGRGGGILVYARKHLCIWKTESAGDFNQGVTVRLKQRAEDINIHVIY